MDLAKWGVAGVCGSYPGPSWLSFQVALSHHTPHLRDPGWGVLFSGGMAPWNRACWHHISCHAHRSHPFTDFIH